MLNIDTDRLREPAAWIMLAVVIIGAFAAIVHLLIPDSGLVTVSFGTRALTSLQSLASPLPTALAVGAVVLVTRFGAPTARARLVALLSAGALGLRLLFSLIALFGVLIGGPAAFGDRFEAFLTGLPMIALAAVAAVFALNATARGPRPAPAPRAEGFYGGHPAQGHQGPPPNGAPQQQAGYGTGGYGQGGPAPVPGQGYAPGQFPDAGQLGEPANQAQPAVQVQDPAHHAPQGQHGQSGQHPAPGQGGPEQGQGMPALASPGSRLPAPAEQYGDQQGRDPAQEPHASQEAHHQGAYPQESYQQGVPGEPYGPPAANAQPEQPQQWPAGPGQNQPYQSQFHQEQSASHGPGGPQGWQPPQTGAHYADQYGSSGQYAPAAQQPEWPAPQGYGAEPAASAAPYGRAPEPMETGGHVPQGLPPLPAPADGGRPAQDAHQGQPLGGYAPAQGHDQYGYPGTPAQVTPPTGDGHGAHQPQQDAVYPSYGDYPAAQQFGPQGVEQGRQESGQGPATVVFEPGFDSSYGRPPAYDGPAYESMADPREQQLAQAYQQAQSYQRQARPEDYGSGPTGPLNYQSYYDNPLGHPQTSEPPSYRPADPTERTMSFHPVGYQADPLSGSNRSEEPLDPTAIYAPDRTQAKREEGSGTDQQGRGTEPNLPWYGSDHR